MEVVIILNLIISISTLILGVIIFYNKTDGHSGFSQSQETIARSHFPFHSSPSKSSTQNISATKRKPIVMDDEKAYHLEREERSKRKPSF